MHSLTKVLLYQFSFIIYNYLVNTEVVERICSVSVAFFKAKKGLLNCHGGNSKTGLKVIATLKSSESERHTY